jgi:prophage regulatory protein
MTSNNPSCAHDESYDNGPSLLMGDLQILRLEQVKQVVGLGRTSIYQMMGTGDFPRPVSLGPRAIGWRYGDIKAWLLSRQPC